MITGPILELARLMGTVSREKNFKVRTSVCSNDEIGALASGFNDMLVQIQMRDEELDQHRRNLEEIVTIRTAEVDNIIKSMIDLLIVLLPDGTIARANAAAWTLLGYM